jgi:serine/threonine-protein kinase
VLEHPDRIGRYSLVRKLATGGMAEVFLAKVDGPGGFEKQVVLKLILPEFARNPTFIDLFLREARLMGTFEHPNVAQVFDFGHEGNNYFLAMEFVDGPTLRQVKRRVASQGWQLPIDAVATIVARACEGLHYVHELKDPRSNEPLELVHRDVSPDNIMLSRKGIVKVLDFGIAKDPQAESTTRSGTVRGKLHYMAPEQLSEQPVDRRVDVWALGIVLFELLALRKPYNGTVDAVVMKAILFDDFLPIRSVRPDVPQALADIVDACLKKDRDQRISSARELQYQLETFVARSGTALSSYDLASLVNDLVEGRPPRSGSSTQRQPVLTSSPSLPRIATPEVARNEPVQPPTMTQATTQPATVSSPSMPLETRTVTTPARPNALRASRGRSWLVPSALGLVVLVGAAVLLWRAAALETPEAVTTSVAVPVLVPPPTAAVEPAPIDVAPPPEVVEAPSAPSPDASVGDAVVPLPRVKERAPPTRPIERPKVSKVSPARLVDPPDEAAPPAPQRAPLQIRVLPEGEAELDGAPAPATVTAGTHTLTLRNKRFGDVSRSLVVKPCSGRIIVGYSFQSDKLSVTCRDL